MNEITGLIPNLVKMVEIPGNGEMKKQIVMTAVKEIMKKMGILNPFTEIAVSVMIDGVVKLLNN
ncbi:MAG TPA: hypothetical protein PLS66_11510 [Tepiditoga sp.]|nr:hypothetical protein [Tepiditoga sp.]